MKLAALGVVTLAIGAIESVPGLIGIGAWWVVMGFVARQQADALKALQPARGAVSKAQPSVDNRTFFLGTLLWLGIGVPSLAVGIGTIGIDPEHQDWRWLPIIVGGLALFVGVVGASLYLAGSAVLAASNGGGNPTHPARLSIRSVKETGTFVNERPRMEFEFHVEPDPTTGLAPYDVTKKATVPFTAMAYLRVGDGFKALVEGPDNPTSMEIHWDQPVAGS